ncbi:hypothetical protein [Lysinibacillus contaminans]|nr:hypothetical protein [Lysinibacillus contaminans]
MVRVKGYCGVRTEVQNLDVQEQAIKKYADKSSRSKRYQVEQMKEQN